MSKINPNRERARVNNYKNLTLEEKALNYLDIPADSRPPIPVILGHLS